MWGVGAGCGASDHGKEDAAVVLQGDTCGRSRLTRIHAPVVSRGRVLIIKEDECVKISIQNMKCAGCVSAVTEALSELPGVETVSVDLDAAAAEIEGAVDMELLKSTLAALGYPVKEE